MFECETHECYHSTMEYAITEIIDQQGINQNYGRVVTTDLWNNATPFIRYDTQDIIELSDKKCPCGRAHMPIKKIIGRDVDLLISSEGAGVSPHQISVFFKSLSDVDQFQVIQDQLKSFTVYIVSQKTDLSKTDKQIKDFWSITFGKEANVDIKVVNDIPLTRSGKRRYVIRSKDVPLIL